MHSVQLQFVISSASLTDAAVVATSCFPAAAYCLIVLLSGQYFAVYVNCRLQRPIVYLCARAFWLNATPEHRRHAIKGGMLLSSDVAVASVVCCWTLHQQIVSLVLFAAVIKMHMSLCSCAADELQKNQPVLCYRCHCCCLWTLASLMQPL